MAKLFPYFLVNYMGILLISQSEDTIWYLGIKTKIKLNYYDI
jgi:hypothetical protein